MQGQHQGIDEPVYIIIAPRCRRQTSMGGHRSGGICRDTPSTPGRHRFWLIDGTLSPPSIQRCLRSPSNFKMFSCHNEVIRPLHDCTYVLNLHALIWGIGEICVIVHGIASEPTNVFSNMLYWHFHRSPAIMLQSDIETFRPPPSHFNLRTRFCHSTKQWVLEEYLSSYPGPKRLYTIEWQSACLWQSHFGPHPPHEQ